MKKYIVQMAWKGKLLAKYLLTSPRFAAEGIYSECYLYSDDGHLLNDKSKGLFPWEDLLSMEVVKE